MSLKIHWDGDRAVIIPGLVELIVFEDGDEKDRWWAEISFPPVRCWIGMNEQDPYPTKDGAKAAVSAELTRRIHILRQVFAGLTSV